MAGDLGGAAVEREVDALAVDLDGLGDAAVEQDVAAGDQRPEPAGSKAARLVHGELGGQAPVVDRLRAVRRRRAAGRPSPARGRSGRRRRRAGTRGACGLLARLVESVAASGWSSTWASSAGRLDTDRGEDRVGFGLDELERVVALARSGKHGLDLVASRPLGGRPEVGHRARSGRRRWGRRCRRRGGAWTAVLGAGSAPWTGLGRCDSRRAAWDALGWVQARSVRPSRRDRDRDSKQRQDGDKGKPFHGRECASQGSELRTTPRACSGRTRDGRGRHA